MIVVLPKGLFYKEHYTVDTIKWFSQQFRLKDPGRACVDIPTLYMQSISVICIPDDFHRNEPICCRREILFQDNYLPYLISNYIT